MFFGRVRTKVWMMTGITVCLLFAGGCAKQAKAPEPAKVVDAATQAQLQKLNQIADAMYQKASEGDIPETRNKLIEVQKQVGLIPLGTVTSPDGAAALTETVNEAVAVYNAVKFSMTEGQTAAAKVRLATDALSHREQPMWLQYHRVIMEDVHGVEQQVNSRQWSALGTGLKQLQAHYSVIRPSALINREVSEVVKVDSLFTFLESQASAGEPSSANLSRGVLQLREALESLFHKKDAAAYVPFVEPNQPVYWVAGIGTVIIMALTYAAWRMKNYERHTVPSRRRVR